jgi:O-antigen/teichoic acid export membrane protein
MDLFSRFKKDYFNYLLSTITPVIITAVSIPLFKHILGAEGYGRFSISFNSILLCTAILSGWIWQSILRYFPASNNKQSFVSKSFLISCITQTVFLLPVVVVVWYIYRDLLLAIFFSLTLFISSLQFSLLALSQSVFLSRKSIYYELIRNVSYISLALVLLKLTSLNFMYALFSAIVVSYSLSFIYLYRQMTKQLQNDHAVKLKEENLKTIFRRFFLYGWPLSLWFVFSLLATLVDKYFILKTAGPVIQGNYQAIFDFLSKGINVLITPVTISLFPLLTNAYQTGKKDDIKRLLSIIVGFEMLGLALADILYWWFGADILSVLLKTPNTSEFRMMGLLVITGSFIWQIAMVIHKRHELKYKSRLLLRMMLIAFLSQVLLYIFFNKSGSMLLYPAGYTLASVIYLLLVSFDLIKQLLNGNHTP